MKLYKVCGYTLTNLAIRPIEGKRQYFMHSYEECSLYFENLDDAIAYGFRHCYAECFTIINMGTYEKVFRSSTNKVEL